VQVVLNLLTSSDISVTVYQLMQHRPKSDVDTGHETYRTRVVVIMYIVVLCSVKYMLVIVHTYYAL
jgi:hypothetical protein